MKKLFLLLTLATVCLVGCDSNQNGQVYVNSPQPQDVYVTPVATNLGDNLNLQALGELVKGAKNAQDLEDKLNKTGSINNLDLDNDNNVDYIKVTEYGDGTTKGFSFTVDLADGTSQEIATVEIQQGQGANAQASLNINGNQQVYGNNNYYSSNYSMSDLLIMSYLFSPHGYYHSPYHYGYYPSYYHSYGRVSAASYGGRVSSVTKTSKITKTTTTRTSTVKSPNSNLASKSVSARAKTLAAPTKSQKSFTKTSSAASKPSTRGFGSGSSSRSSSSSSASKSSSSRSSGGFGSSSRSSGGRSSSSRSSGSRRSDMRFKTNITPLTSSLDKVCSLQGVSYDWKVSAFPAEHFENKKQIGFLAQDLEKVYPAVVNTRTDGYKTVDYDLLVPALVESIKELKAQNVKQDSVISYLTGKTFTAKK